MIERQDSGKSRLDSATSEGLTRHKLPTNPRARRTAQDVFNEVTAHLMTQGRKARRGGGQGLCAYRGDDGTKCAVGCLIPDDVYESYESHRGFENRLEGEDVYDSYVLEALHAAGIDPELAPLLKELQGVHDLSTVDAWPQELGHVAQAYGLAYNLGKGI